MQLTEMHFLVVAPPLWGITVSRIDILERNREVDKEEVEVLETPVSQLLPCKLFYLNDQ